MFLVAENWKVAIITYHKCFTEILFILAETPGIKWNYTYYVFIVHIRCSHFKHNNHPTGYLEIESFLVNLQDVVANSFTFCILAVFIYGACIGAWLFGIVTFEFCVPFWDLLLSFSFLSLRGVKNLKCLMPTPTGQISPFIIVS